MAIVGALIGFFASFIAGAATLRSVLGAGEKYRASRGHPSVRPWLGALNIALACLGAWGGYLLVQAYRM
jgi:hypothetical protein